MNNNLYIFLKSILLILFFNLSLKAQVTFEKEIKITDIALHFDGNKVTSDTAPNSTTGYDYAFGPQISAHGDCIFTYKHYVFMTWYKGGKENRNMMLTRYNTETGTQKTIEFPHKHTGFRNVWYIGESHNTIGIGVSPLDGTIHLLFDMHAYSRTRPTNGSLANDYFRYSYSKKNVADLPDEEFTIDQFVEDSGAGDYTHLSLNGAIDYNAFSEFTYPQFFLNTQGDLFFSMRKGSSPNGGYHFAKYDANTSTWSNFIKFADKNAKNFGEPYNWGMYGRLQFVGGKIAIGFQKRSSNTNDRYLYQNGFYFAYSDDQSGQTGWKNYKGESFTTPLRNADKILVYEPGDLVTTTQKDQVYMVGNFDWTITERGDIHIIGRVRDDENNITKNVHTFQKAGDSEFTTSTDFIGGNRLFTSGNNIYMIRLNSGRIYIEQSLGGTNNFRKVYEATSGKQFSHGRAYVSNGKLYYYMMEQSTGDQRPLYLHIIDLGIDNSPFQVSLISPIKNESYEVDKPLEISAEAFNNNGSVSKVEFIINNQIFEEDTTSPYTVNYTPDIEGTYTIKAIAYDENNATVSSQEINIEVFRRNANDLSGDIYRLKNVATGKYLTSSGSSIIASDSDEGSDKEWQFVKAEVPGFDYYNIDSEVRGIIRFTGGASNPGLVSTNFGSPNTNVDKIWRVIANNDGSFSFATRTSDRFLYHESDGSMTHSSNTDDRSKWIPESTTLSLENLNNTIHSSIKIYPNPSNGNFMLKLNNINSATILIYNLLGKIVHSEKVNTEFIEIKNQKRFETGVYMVKVVSKETNKVYHTKLVIQ